MKSLVIIAAADAQWGIGKGGKLPWNVPDDLARFRRRTMGKTVILGRRTREGLPKELVGRRLVTVSASGNGDFPSVRAAYEAAGDGEVFAAGGTAIYREALAIADSAEITRFEGDFGCTTQMPDLASCGWTMIELIEENTIQIEKWERIPK